MVFSALYAFEMSTMACGATSAWVSFTCPLVCTIGCTTDSVTALG